MVDTNANHYDTFVQASSRYKLRTHLKGSLLHSTLWLFLEDTLGIRFPIQESFPFLMVTGFAMNNSFATVINDGFV